LIVDEAQNLSFAALEELRMLSNIVVDRTMALQSFLLAQPQFRTVLGSGSLEQLRQRVTAAYHLGPLSEPDTKAYIEHRLRRADWKGDPRFTEGSFSLIHRQTEGVPRRINSLCTRLLLYGFLEQLHTLSENDIERVANDAREELATVTLPPAAAARDGERAPEIAGRIRALEEKVGKHERLIRRALEIAARYFLGEER
jgi:general secretion pathway protein A